MLYDEGVCYRCIRLDSRGGDYREYSRKKHRSYTRPEWWYANRHTLPGPQD